MAAERGASNTPPGLTSHKVNNTMRKAVAQPIPPAADPQHRSVVASRPSIETLGRWLADVDREYDLQDNLSLRSADITLKNAAQDAMSILHGKAEALRNLIVGTPAITLADAAVQAHAAGCFACQLAGAQVDDDERRDLGRILERVIYSIVAVVAPAAGLDIEAMQYAQDVSLRDRRFAGLEGVA